MNAPPARESRRPAGTRSTAEVLADETGTRLATEERPVEALRLDLRGYRERGRNRWRTERARLDGWTANASPLDHWLMVAGPERPEAWAEHLNLCPNCAREQARADRERGAA